MSAVEEGVVYDSTERITTRSHLMKWLDLIDYFLVDCDGVLWRGTTGIEGVSETYKLLCSLGKKVYFVTNNATKERSEYVDKLREYAGIECTVDEVVTSAYAAAVYLKANNITKKVYVLGGSGLVSELKSVAKVEVLGHEDAFAPFSFGELDPKTLDPDVEAVVIGFDPTFCYAKLAKASMYLRYGKDVKFVATNRDLTYPDSHAVLPGGGSMVLSLCAGSGREPDVVAGKPNVSLINLLEQGAGLSRARSCMVGDRLDTDILFGNKCGLASSLLVLTGVTERERGLAFTEAVGYADGQKRPSHVIDSFADIARIYNS